jgi:hypothetical protein
MSPSEVPLNPIIYPIVISIAALAAALILMSLAVSSITLSVRRRRRGAMQAWKALGLTLVRVPAQANFLNEPRAFGVGNNGTLALTPTHLRFAQVMPEREIVIALKDIASVHVVAKFNGRVGGPFLVVKRTVGDLTGFQLSNPSVWADAIDQVRVSDATVAPVGELVMA